MCVSDCVKCYKKMEDCSECDRLYCYTCNGFRECKQCLRQKKMQRYDANMLFF